MTLREEMELRLCQAGLSPEEAHNCLKAALVSKSAQDFVVSCYGSDCWDKENTTFFEDVRDRIFQSTIMEEAISWLTSEVRSYNSKPPILKDAATTFIADRLGLTVTETVECLHAIMHEARKDEAFLTRFGSTCWEKEISQFTTNELFDDIFQRFVLPQAFRWVLLRYRTMGWR